MQHEFTVSGMNCGHCEVQIDLPSGRVKVQSEQPRQALVAAIAEEGYEVRE